MPKEKTSISLSEDAKIMLPLISKARRLNMSLMVEHLIFEEAKRLKIKLPIDNK